MRRRGARFEAFLLACPRCERRAALRVEITDNRAITTCRWEDCGEVDDRPRTATRLGPRQVHGPTQPFTAPLLRPAG